MYNYIDLFEIQYTYMNNIYIYMNNIYIISINFLE